MTTTDLADRNDILHEARHMAREGMFLNALDQIKQHGNLTDWNGLQRTQVAWIIRELGAPRLAKWHTLKAIREEPDSLAVRNDYVSLLMDSRGPLESLEYLEANAEPDAESRAEDRLHWSWLHAACFGMLRDFESAYHWVEKMEDVGERPEDAYFLRAQILEKQDRYEESLQAIDESISLRNSHRAIQYKAHLLRLRGLDDQAYEILAVADTEKQVASLSWQQSAIAYERCDFADCEAKLDRFDFLTPLRERAFADSFLTVRSELARRRGDDGLAIEYALRSRTARGREIANHLSDPDRRERTDRLLDVPFIRQHEMTCGPATLAAISQYWGMPAEHLEVAEEICYAGTSSHAERQWAKDHGFATAEFTMTEGVTEALIARGVPFTLVTRSAGFAHLQAVVGYDGRTSTVMIRDPYFRSRGMADLSKLLESQAAHGPRGLALVPLKKASLLHGIQFPDAERYDAIHAMDGALIHHRRAEAAAVLDKLERQSPDHRLTFQARRQLAIYDGNEEAMLQAVQALRASYEDESSLQQAEVSLLGSLGKSQQRLELLRKFVDRPSPHPVLLCLLGDALALDGRTRGEAERHMREAIRRNPTYGRAYLSLADLWFQRGRRTEALRLYHFATCLEETDEFAASQYFEAALATGRAGDVLEWLHRRFDRYGDRSTQPTITFVDGLLRVRRFDDALATLKTAMQRRADDAELKLYAARTLAELSSEHWEYANELLQEAREHSPERTWVSVASRLCVLRGELTEARDLLQRLMPRNPLALWLHESIAELCEQLDGVGAGTRYWRSVAEECPHHIPLQERYAMSLRGQPLSETQPVLERIIENNPENAWAVRELAQHLLGAGLLDEAEQKIQRALELDAEDPFVDHLQSTLAYRRGDHATALEFTRELLRKNINDEQALYKLFNMCETADETRRELAWFLEQLRQEPITGEVLLGYREFASAVLPADTVLHQLQEALEMRSELWPVHQAVIRQLSHMERFDEATELSQAAIDQFPLEQATYFERYQIALHTGDQTTQLDMLQRLLQLNPRNSVAIRALAELHGMQGHQERARDLLDQLVNQQPFDPINRGYLADCFLELGEKELAYEQCVRAVKLSPGYDFAWSMLDRLADELGRKEHREQLIRELTRDRPNDEDTWLQLASVEMENEAWEAAESCVERAEAIDPYNTRVHTLRSRIRIFQGDQEGALSALTPPIFTTVPGRLRLHRAQLMWDLGNHDDAYAEVKATVKEDPGYEQAWVMLRRWAMLRNDRELAIAATDHQVQLSPNDPEVLDDAARIYADFDEDERAIAVFQRILEIAPHYTATRCRFFDLLTEQERWDEAAPLVQSLTRLDDHPAVIARRMRVACHRGDMKVRDEAFDAIFASLPVNRWAMDTAIGLLNEKEPSTTVVARLFATLKRKIADYNESCQTTDSMGECDGEELRDAVAAISELWVETIATSDSRALKRGLKQCERISSEFFQSKGAGEHVASRAILSNLLRWLGFQTDLTAFRRNLKRHGVRIQKDPELWSIVAFIYATHSTRFSKRTMRRWLTHLDRLELQPWMITNAHELLRLVGQGDRAKQLVLVALEAPADATRSQLAFWATYDALREGDDKRSIMHFMQAARMEDLEGNDRMLHTWLEAVLHMRQSEDKVAAFRDVRQRMKDFVPEFGFLRDQPLYSAFWNAVVSMIVSEAGSRMAKRWGRRQKAKIAWAAFSRVRLVP